MDKNYVVSKSNHFIINSSYDLSLEEQRLILTLASMVQPSDEEFKPYKFKIKDFMNLLGIKSKTKYSSIPFITKELMKKVFEIVEGKKTIQVAWLSSVVHDNEEGSVTLEFSPMLKPYLLELGAYFTNYKLANILQMKSKYSPRLYELLKMNEYKKKGFEMKVEELRKLFKAEEVYPLYADFKRRVLLKSQSELEKHSDISFKFQEIKLGRRVDSIKFFVFGNLSEPKKKKIKIKAIENDKKVLKVEKDLEESKKRIDKVYQENQKQYALYLAMEEDKREEIDKLAEKYYIELIGAKRLGSVTRKAFEKAKKTYIIKAMDIK